VDISIILARPQNYTIMSRTLSLVGLIITLSLVISYVATDDSGSYGSTFSSNGNNLDTDTNTETIDTSPIPVSIRDTSLPTSSSGSSNFESDDSCHLPDCIILNGTSDRVSYLMNFGPSNITKWLCKNQYNTLCTLGQFGCVCANWSVYYDTKVNDIIHPGLLKFFRNQTYTGDDEVIYPARMMTNTKKRYRIQRVEDDDIYLFPKTLADAWKGYQKTSNIPGISELMTLSLKNNVLTVAIPDYSYTILELSKPPFYKPYLVNESMMFIELPALCTSTSGWMTARLIRAGDTIDEDQVFIPGITWCLAKDQFWSTETTEFISCEPSTLKSVTIAAYVFASLFFVCLLLLILALFKIYKLHTLPIRKWRNWKAKNIPQDEEVELFDHNSSPIMTSMSVTPKSDPYVEMRDYDESTHTGTLVSTVKVNATRANSPSAVRTYAMHLTILAMIAGGMACDNNPTLTSHSNVCTLNAGAQTENCKLQFTLQSTFNDVGSSSCLSMMGANGTNIPLTLTMLSYTDTVVSTVKYYGCDWTPNDFVVFHCPSIESCEGQDCANFNGVSNPAACFNEDSNSECLFYASDLVAPGVTQCSAGGQCITVGCGLCNPSCIYTRWWKKCTGNIYEVKTINIHQYVATIRLQLGSPLNVDITVPITSGSPVTTNGLTFSFVAANTATTISFNGNDFIIENGEGMIGPTSPVNTPLTRSWGDTQSNSILALQNAYPTAQYIANMQDVSLNLQSNGATFTFPPCGSSLYGSMTELPATIGPAFWDVSASTQGLFGLWTGAVALTLDLQTYNTLNYTITVTEVCPEVTLLNVTGCSSCTPGVVVYVTAYSTCSAGLARVNTSNDHWQLTTGGLTLTMTPATYRITLLTSDISNSATLLIGSDPNVATIAVSFTAPTLQQVQQANSTVINNPGDNTISGNLNLGNFLNGLTEAQQIGTLIGIIAGSIILLAIIVLIIYCVIRHHRRELAGLVYEKLIPDSVQASLPGKLSNFFGRKDKASDVVM
jgi:hypothetical protein